MVHLNFIIFQIFMKMYMPCIYINLYSWNKYNCFFVFSITTETRNPHGICYPLCPLSFMPVATLSTVALIMHTTTTEEIVEIQT